ncbi:hypothetical protein [Roseateles terrae]|uniref:Uncharacterized protein n=1 Tax=Roseateles terrae TaxID=431060 RepID=A0ABR6GU50_9BURK|nr:hypothetical protein [Roseateles terrae]MBB3195645.1 hypothetical protein [Roseateles terrae]
MAAAFSAPPQGPAATLGAGATASPATTPTAHDPETWTSLANLTQIIDKMREQVGQVTLARTDLSRLNTALQQADPVCLPPDRHALMNEWRAELQHALAVPDEGAKPRVVAGGERLTSLLSLLRDVQITHSRPALQARSDSSQWESLPPSKQNHMRKLGEWMSEGSGAQRAARTAFGRQVALQYAGLSNELKVGATGVPLDLPHADVLHGLMNPSTRAHVTLAGPVGGRDLEHSLSALPLRTWHVNDTDHLRWAVQQAPVNLQTLDLHDWEGDLDLEAVSLLSQAAEAMPNLASLILPSRVDGYVLGDAWEASPGASGWTYSLKDRPDILSLLDAAVASLDGHVLGTRTAIRHVANKADAACLLAFAERLSAHIDFRLGALLLDMFTRAATSDEDLRGYAEALRKAQKQGLGPVETMDAVQEPMAARVSTAAQLGAEAPRAGVWAGTVSRETTPVAGPAPAAVSRLAADIPSRTADRRPAVPPRVASSATLPSRGHDTAVRTAAAETPAAAASPPSTTVQRRFQGAPVLTLQRPPRPTLAPLNRSKPAPVHASSPAQTVVRSKVPPPPPPRVSSVPTSLALATARATSEFFASSGLAFEQPFSPISLDGADNESVGPHGSGFETDVSGLDSPDGWPLPPFPEAAESSPELSSQAAPFRPAPPPTLADDSAISASDTEFASSTLESSVSVQSMVWKPASRPSAAGPAWAFTAAAAPTRTIDTPAPAWARFPRPTAVPPAPPRRAPQLASKATTVGTLNLTPPGSSRAPTVQASRRERDIELAALRAPNAERRLERAAIEAKLTQTLKR